MASLHDLADSCDAAQMTIADVEDYASEQGLTTAQVYEAIALHLAKGYADRVLSFEFCDSAMGFLMGLTKYDVSPFVQDVYSAFDEGEFRHGNDGIDVDPAEKYARPWIERILARGSPASG